MGGRLDGGGALGLVARASYETAPAQHHESLPPSGSSTSWGIKGDYQLSVATFAIGPQWRRRATRTLWWAGALTPALMMLHGQVDRALGDWRGNFFSAALEASLETGWCIAPPWFVSLGLEVDYAWWRTRYVDLAGDTLWTQPRLSLNGVFFVGWAPGLAW